MRNEFAEKFHFTRNESKKSRNPFLVCVCIEISKITSENMAIIICICHTTKSQDFVYTWNSFAWFNGEREPKGELMKLANYQNCFAAVASKQQTKCFFFFREVEKKMANTKCLTFFPLLAFLNANHKSLSVRTASHIHFFSNNFLCFESRICLFFVLTGTRSGYFRRILSPSARRFSNGHSSLYWNFMFTGLFFLSRNA